MLTFNTFAIQYGNNKMGKTDWYKNDRMSNITSKLHCIGREKLMESLHDVIVL